MDGGDWSDWKGRREEWDPRAGWGVQGLRDMVRAGGAKASPSFLGHAWRITKRDEETSLEDSNVAAWGFKNRGMGKKQIFLLCWRCLCQLSLGCSIPRIFTPSCSERFSLC